MRQPSSDRCAHAAASAGRALVLDPGDTLSALAGTRALGRAGWQVGVAAPSETTLAGSSRYARRRHVVTSPAEDLDRFVREVADVASTWSYDVVLPAGDAELLAVSLRRHELPVHVPYAPHEAVVRAVDKMELTRVAVAAGLDAPLTRPASDRELEMWDGPLVVKSRLHWTPGVGAARSEPSFHDDPRSARLRVQHLVTTGVGAVLQARLEGRLMAMACVTDGSGRVVARVLQETEGVWPSPPGISLRARTVPVDRELADAVDDILARLGWFGLAQLQFLRTVDGTPHLIDFNGRLYGSLSLAMSAGVNLPHAWACHALGLPYRSTEPRRHVRYHWFEGDLRRALAAPSRRMADVVGCLRYFRGATNPITARDDMAPAWRYVSKLPVRAARRLLGRFGQVRS